MRWNREVDRAIVSGISEKEIQQIKKECQTDLQSTIHKKMTEGRDNRHSVILN